MLTNNAVKRALAKRQRQKATESPFNLSDYLFTEQLAFVQDPAKYKLAVCSRRAGKTTSCAADLIFTATNNPGVVCLYITLSRRNAKRIIWKELLKINRAYKLGGDANISELSLTFPNESVVYISGAKDVSEIENFRGVPIKLCYIDEVQSFRPYVKELIDDVLSASFMDYDGTLCLIGTPGAIPVGYFYECAEKSDQWSKHKWTFWNNPFLVKTSGKTHQQMLDRELKRRGVAENDPSIRREFFGEWVQDQDSLLLHYDPAKNHYQALPQDKWHYILGVDIGLEDADALAVLAWSENSPDIYLVEEDVNPGQDITDLTKKIEALRVKYDLSKIVIDTGGLGKKIAEELTRRYAIPLQSADKARKMENIALLNTYLRTGRFKAKSASKFAQDSFLVEIDREKSTPDKIKVSDKYHSDIIDAVLYAFRESPAYSWQAPVKKPITGTPEWASEQEKDMFEAEYKLAQERAEYERYVNGLGWDDN